MPYQTAPNSGVGQLANSLTRIFVGDPKADALYQHQQIQNETEYQKQKHLQEQVLTEAVRRKEMEAQAAAATAAAAANQGLANERGRKNKAAIDLGSLFQTDQTNYTQPGGASMSGDAPAGTPGKGFNMADPATAAKVVSLAIQGGMDPKTLAPIAMIPGQSDETLGRIMTGTGNTLGKDEYVGINDRNTNRRYEVGAGQRLVGSDGDVKLGVDPAYVSGGRGGNKIPKLDQNDMNAMIRSAITSRGAALDPKMPVAAYFNPQPDLYANLARLVQHGWDTGGGNAAAVQALLAQYLEGQDFSKFGTPNAGIPYVPFTGNDHQLITPKIDINALLGAAQPAGVDPTLFTGGAHPALPSRQNVGNSGGWGIEKVIPAGR